MGNAMKSSYLVELALIYLISVLPNQVAAQADPGPWDRSDGIGPYSRIIVDHDRDIRTTIRGNFTVATVGDIVPVRPIAQLEDDSLQSVISILRTADVAVGNFEATISKFEDVNGLHPSVFLSLSEPEIADDMAALGFDMFNHANNHTIHWGLEAMYETYRQLDRVGIIHAGGGYNLADAEEAKYFESSKGRVGLLGITTNAGNGFIAEEATGKSYGKPGTNYLEITRSITVSAETLGYFRAAKESAPHIFPGTYPVSSLRTYTDTGDAIVIYGNRYVAGDTPGYSYTIPDDELETYAREVRNGKYYSDFVIANIHSHHWDVPEDAKGPWDKSRNPPNFLVRLAHTAIDNGADVFFVHGEGEVRGVEIYKGRPIFYGLGNFIRHPYHNHVIPPNFWERTAQLLNRETSTDAEVSAWAVTEVHDREYFESVVAVSQFQDGKLAEVRLYPIDLRFDGPFVDVGIPFLANKEIADRVLSRIEAGSEMFGTEFQRAGNVGIIRVD